MDLSFINSYLNGYEQGLKVESDSGFLSPDIYQAKIQVVQDIRNQIKDFIKEVNKLVT